MSSEPGARPASMWSAATDARLRELWAAGLSGTAIAERLGCSKNSVFGRVHRLGLKPRGSPVKGGLMAAVEARARNRAAKAKLMRELAETLCAQRASKPRPIAPLERPPAPAATVEPPKSPLRLWMVPTGPVHECQWPEGHPRQPGFRFCGEPCEPGQPYCRSHCRRAYAGSAGADQHVFQGR